MAKIGVRFLYYITTLEQYFWLFLYQLYVKYFNADIPRDLPYSKAAIDIWKDDSTVCVYRFPPSRVTPLMWKKKIVGSDNTTASDSVTVTECDQLISCWIIIISQCSVSNIAN